MDFSVAEGGEEKHYTACLVGVFVFLTGDRWIALI
jgi:hypothetical protein